MKNFYNKLGNECFNHFKEINPKGGMREFIRMAVEFGYRRAIDNNKKWFKLYNFIIGVIIGILITYIISYFFN